MNETGSDSQRRFWPIVGGMLILALVVLGGTTCQSSGGKEQEADNTSASEASEDNGADETTSEEGVPPEDLYPGMNFSALDGDQRRLFVKVAKGELCPCKGSNQSLHGCLQAKKSQCKSAQKVGALIASGVRNGLDKKAVQSRVAKMQKQLTQKYEFKLDNTPRLGPTNAPVSIVEFADFQCPHCKRASEALKKVKRKFGDEVVHYFKHYPLKAHPQAELAARASIAAHRQGEFWAMHDLLFAHQKSLSRRKIMSFARQLGLNISEFKSDLKAPSVSGIIRADKRAAQNANIQGTPAIFINGDKYMGANTVDALSDAVDKALREKKSSQEGNSGENDEEESDNAKSSEPSQKDQ